MKIFRGILIVALAAVIGAGLWFIGRDAREREVLRQIIQRLEADSRIAQVLVTEVRTDPATGKNWTRIKFLEFDAAGRPLLPRYFAFSGNVIQFQSLVVRFADSFVEAGDRLRGKSAYLFLKVFFLDGSRTQVYDLTPAQSVPEGYKVVSLPASAAKIEEAFWSEFWRYALDRAAANKAGIKNAQIEAPGMKFVPGILYTIKIEHDGGMRIDSEPLPEILKGENIPS